MRNVAIMAAAVVIGVGFTGSALAGIPPDRVASGPRKTYLVS